MNYIVTCESARRRGGGWWRERTEYSILTYFGALFYLHPGRKFSWYSEEVKWNCDSEYSNSLLHREFDFQEVLITNMLSLHRSIFRILSNIEHGGFCKNRFDVWRGSEYTSVMIWVNVFKNGLCKTCERHPLKFEPYHFNFFKGCLSQILLGQFLNSLSQMYFVVSRSIK